MSGSDIEPYLRELVRLRIAVFREFPYLYDGDAEYEAGYMRKYAASKNSVFVLALSGGDVVGVSTGVPLLDADADFRKPFEQSKYDLADVFSFGVYVIELALCGMGLHCMCFTELYVV